MVLTLDNKQQRRGILVVEEVKERGNLLAEFQLALKDVSASGRVDDQVCRDYGLFLVYNEFIVVEVKLICQVEKLLEFANPNFPMNKPGSPMI
jgi:hypothetical protein